MFITLTCLAALSFSIGGYFMKLSAGLTQFRAFSRVTSCSHGFRRRAPMLHFRF